ncbi:hypothetical protein SNE40_019029 [Patella caerulea]|uniref:Inner centromere protein ARK-binding domain-containing protein n=1 Tax=Patella caerulea TaxID=87958 RepID=A0AAN8J6D1_PATCE
MATLYSRVPHTLGVSHLEAVEGDLANLMLDYEENFLWLDEILEACKKALVTPEVELLPKTPSSKKPRKRIIKKKKEIETESDADDEEGTPPSRKTRQTARQKVLYNKENNKTKEPARKTRGKKQNSGSNENPRMKISPKLTSTNLSKMSDCSELELSEAEMTPVAKSTSRSTLNKTAIGVANQSKNSPYNKEKYSVKQRASAYEEMLGKRSSHSPAITPVNKNKHCTSMDKTPEYNTPDTVKHYKTVSCLDKANVANLNESIINEKTAQKRRSSRKSLKVLSTKVKRLSVHGHHYTRPVEAEDSEEVTEVVEEPKRKPRTRLRLKKKEQVEMSTDESESTCTSVDKDSTTNDGDENKNESKDTVSTYQSPVKNDGTPVPQPRTSKSTCRTPLQSEKESCDEIMKPVSKKISVDKACSSESEVVMDTGSSDDCDTGLKTRRGSRCRKDSSHRDRDSGISGVLSAQSSAVSLRNLEMDSEKTIDHESLKPTRSTRSQSKQYHQSPILEASNTDEVIHPPEVSEPKNNRKRQVDDCEEVSPAPRSKRSCIGIQQDAKAHEEPENELHDTPKTPGRASLDSDQYESMENDSDDYTSPKHRAKIVRPVGLNNSACRSANRPNNLLSGFVNSFVKRNTPVKPLSIDQKKREIMEKEKKNEDRVQRKKEMLNKQMQERKRLREERMKKAAELRMQQERSIFNKQHENVKKMEERLTMQDKIKEEKLREERIQKQNQRLQKQKEAEERRKQDEEERLRKKEEQEEEDRLLRELQEKKKAAEDLERQKRLAEEKQRHDERMAEAERERLQEKERLLQIELEREKENRRHREEREKQYAKEKAEREKLELEKKKERELQIQKEMIKLRELEKARLAKQAAEKEEQQKEKERAQKLIEKHNQATKPLNTTVTHNTSVDSNKQNHNSYDITPAKKKKDNSNNQDYNINDLHSDDSTDDEDAPRKKIPMWAQGTNLKAALINQEYHPPRLDVIFPVLPDLDLNDVFIKRKPRFNKRTSSAVWDSPMLKPCQTAQFNV